MRATNYEFELINAPIDLQHTCALYPHLVSPSSGIRPVLGDAMYLYEAAGGLERKPKVRDGECVALVQVYAGAPHTSTWQPGEKVVESRGLRAGTAIATFVKGRFPRSAQMRRHAAFFLRYGPRDAAGNAINFWVIEQYNHPPILKIQARQIRMRAGGMRADGTWPDASNNPDAFFVIE